MEKPADEQEAGGGRARMEEKRALKTEAILDKALELLGKEGADAVTLQRVASELGHATTALYRYFTSKDAMLAAMQRRAIGEVHGYLRDELAQFQGEEGRRQAAPMVGALADVLKLGECYLRLPTALPAHHRMITLFLGEPRLLLSEEESRNAAPPLVGLLGRAMALLGGASEVGALSSGDTEERVLVLWSTLQGALLLEKLARVTPAAPSSVEVGRSAAEALLLGWGAPAGALSKARRLVTTEVR